MLDRVAVFVDRVAVFVAIAAMISPLSCLLRNMAIIKNDKPIKSGITRVKMNQSLTSHPNPYLPTSATTATIESSINVRMNNDLGEISRFFFVGFALATATL